MKKLFLILTLVSVVMSIGGAQELAASLSSTPFRAATLETAPLMLNDYRAVQEISNHISQDKYLAQQLSIYGPVPNIRLEVRIDTQGKILSTEIIDGFKGEYAYMIQKTVESLSSVTPVVINGVPVPQRIVIPISFQ